MIRNHQGIQRSLESDLGIIDPSSIDPALINHGSDGCNGRRIGFERNVHPADHDLACQSRSR